MIVCAVLCAFSYFKGIDVFWTFPAQIGDAAHEDLVAFYRASQLVGDGMAAAAYDSDVFQNTLTGKNQRLLMLNPPHFFLLIEPLAWAPYGVIKALFIGLFCATFASLARLSGQSWFIALLLLCSGGAYYTFMILNISVLVVVAIVIGLVNAERRPLLAGAALAIATVKPQYGLLVPVFLIAGGHWRTLISASLFTIGLIAFSIWSYGIDVWQAYFASLGQDSYSSYAAVTAPGNLTIQSAAGKLGAPLWLRGSFQTAGLLAGAGLIWFLSRRVTDKRQLIGMLLIVSGFTAPSLMYYSWPIFAVGLCFLMARNVPWPVSLQVAAGLLWLQPIWATALFSLYPQTALSYSVFVTANAALVVWLASLMVQRSATTFENAGPSPECRTGLPAA